jgi:dihydrofolate reductase
LPAMPLTCSVFIATSIDGFIARADGDINWLHDPAYALPDSEDCGYGEFVSTIDTLVMGRRSFEKVLSFGNWPYDKTPVIVLSSQSLQIPGELKTKVHVANLKPQELVAQLAAAGKQHLYIDGGDTIRRFLRAGLIDEMTITKIPILLGHGIPLFGEIAGDVRLSHHRTRNYDNGFVQVTYRIERSV